MCLVFRHSVVLTSALAWPVLACARKYRPTITSYHCSGCKQDPVWVLATTDSLHFPGESADRYSGSSMSLASSSLCWPLEGTDELQSHYLSAAQMQWRHCAVVSCSTTESLQGPKGKNGRPHFLSKFRGSSLAQSSAESMFWSVFIPHVHLYAVPL